MTSQIIRNIGGKITTCERILQYQFREKLLCLKALNAGGSPIDYNGGTHQLAKNDVMAVLGDATMEALLCRRWWMKDTRNKAQWSAVRNDLLSNSKLAARGRALALDRCIIHNPGAQISDKMIADAMEAVMGAVYLDGGETRLTEVVKHLGLDRHAFL